MSGEKEAIEADLAMLSNYTGSIRKVSDDEDSDSLSFIEEEDDEPERVKNLPIKGEISEKTGLVLEEKAVDTSPKENVENVEEDEMCGQALLALVAAQNDEGLPPTEQGQEPSSTCPEMAAVMEVEELLSAETLQVTEVYDNTADFFDALASTSQDNDNDCRLDTTASTSAGEKKALPFGDWEFSDTSGTLYDPNNASTVESTTQDTWNYPVAGDCNDDEMVGSDEEFFMEDDEDLPDDADIPVSFHNALVLNEKYQAEVQMLLENLEEAIRINQMRQAELESEISTISTRGSTGANRLLTSIYLGRNPSTVFYAPYFKDVGLFSHPPNEDTLRKRSNGEVDPYLTNPRELNEAERKRLVSAVRQDAIDKRMRIVGEQERIVLMDVRKASPEGRVELKDRLKKLISQEVDIQAMSDEVLFADINEEFDWMKITLKAFNRDIPPETVRLMWKNNLHPSINRGPWTRAEDRQLLKIVNQPSKNGLSHKTKDWDSVARQLATGRTAFLCFHRFQTKHNRVQNNRRWTEAEDVRLRMLVKRFRMRRFVPWTKVAYFMDRRSKDQCYQRYMNSLREETRRGMFREVEDFVVIVGVKLFGYDWTRIAHFIPNRTTVQIQSRYNSFLKANFDNWTQEEDCRLLNLVKEMGSKNWKAISLHFGRRTRAQCRVRFLHIFNTYKKTPNFSLENLQYVEGESKQKRRQQDIYNNLEAKVTEFLEMNQVDDDEVVESEDDDDGDDTYAPSARLKGYHITPDGERIPMKALIEFMKSLKEELPTKSDAVAHIRSCPNNKLNVEELAASTMAHREKKTGKLVMEMKRTGFMARKLSRRETKSPHMIKVNRALGRYFAPAWPSKTGKQRENYRTMGTLMTARSVAKKYCHILNCYDTLRVATVVGVRMRDFIPRVKNDGDGDYEESYERKDQILNALRVKVDGESSTPASTPKPKVKTYSRKKPTFTPSTDRKCDNNKAMASRQFVPVNRQTLLGMRGLFLCIRRLQRMSKLGILQDNSYDVGQILQRGIHSSVMLNRSNDDSDVQVVANSRQVEEADRRLKQRMISLFFWPALMSIARPNDRGDIFNLLEDEPVVAACEPFDTNEIITEAQIKAATSPRKLIIHKPELPGQFTAVHIYDPNSDLDEEVEDEEEQNVKVAPPPIKKRILAQNANLPKMDGETP